MKKLLAVGFAVLTLSVGAIVVYAQSEAKKEQAENAAAKSAKVLEKAPKAVQDTVKKLVGTGTIVDFDAEKDGTYEVEYKVHGVAKSAEIAKDGKILELEETVAVSTLPKTVTDAVKKLVPKGKIKRAETSTKDGRTVYELEVSQSVTISADGKVQEE
jgi:hypothetical protein